jgi:2,4-dienoyl-CoA reductase-like NADH-dependent reductase (Old Yellow Enzyme family)/8-oxo-dGTP pyrophosphatase MutT (NUDIX family)
MGGMVSLGMGGDPNCRSRDEDGMKESQSSERLLWPASLTLSRDQIISSWTETLSQWSSDPPEPYLALARVVRYNGALGAFALLAIAQPPMRNGPVRRLGGQVSRRQPSHRDVAVAALLDERDRVLLVRTRKLPDTWQPPGGGVDPQDSSPVAALAREIDEELGLSISPERFGFEFRTNYDFGSGSVYCFSAKVGHTPPLVLNRSEIEEAAWFPLPLARDLPSYPATTALIEHLVESARHNSGESLYSRSLSRLCLGDVQLKNRVGVGPINSSLFNGDGSISELHLSFYSRFVSGGVGLLYVGGVAVSRAGRSNAGSLVLARPEDTRGVTTLAELCRNAGITLAVQLMHSGRQARSVEIGHPLVAASAIPCPVVGEVPRELQRDEIRAVCRQFGKAAALAETAGADLIEIHGAHGYLVGGFLSPYSNLRTDEYRAVIGGESRFLTELLTEVRSHTSLPVGLRISAVENVPGGLDIDALLGTLSYVREELAFLSVTGGVYVPEGDVIIPNRQLAHMLWREQAALLRRSLALPVLLSGNFHTLEEIESTLADKCADAILMVRTFLAEPDFLQKVLAGQSQAVHECINCNQCKYHTRKEPHVYCPFNRELIAIRRHWLRSRR